MFLHTFRLYYEFGKVLVDRAALGILKKGRVEAELSLQLKIRELLGENKGLIILSAHVGSWQTAASGLEFRGIPVSILYRREQDDIDRQYFEHGAEFKPIRFIDPRKVPEGMLEMIAVLKRGEILCFMGDRVSRDEGNVLRCSFLDGFAAFPISVYKLASAMDTPIAVLFCSRTGCAASRIELSGVLRLPRIKGKNPESFRPYAEFYIQALEEFTKMHPYQFFNFYDLWSDASHTQT